MEFLIMKFSPLPVTSSLLGSNILFSNTLSQRFLPLTLKKECRIWVFENRVLRRLFGPKRYEVTGEWGELHNWELMSCTSHPILFG
jgi:hypothetical protein